MMPYARDIAHLPESTSKIVLCRNKTMSWSAETYNMTMDHTFRHFPDATFRASAKTSNGGRTPPFVSTFLFPPVSRLGTTTDIMYMSIGQTPHLACCLCFPAIRKISAADVDFLVDLRSSPAANIGCRRGPPHGRHHHPLWPKTRMKCPAHQMTSPKHRSRLSQVSTPSHDRQPSLLT